MTPRYVVVLESKELSSATEAFEFGDDVQALVGARRLFVQELMVNEARPLCVALGRQTDDGKVDWLSAWRATS